MHFIRYRHKKPTASFVLPLHRALENVSELVELLGLVVLACEEGGEVENTTLREHTLGESLDVGRRVADLGETAGNGKTVEELLDLVVENRTDVGVRDLVELSGTLLAHEDGGGGAVTLGVGGSGELEHGGSGERNSNTVGDEGDVGAVRGVEVLLVLGTSLVERRDGVRTGVAEVDTCVSESDTGSGRGEEHLGASLLVTVGVTEDTGEVLDSLLKSPLGEDVRDGVGTLVSGTLDRVVGAGSTSPVWDGSVGLERVEEHIETSSDSDLTGAGGGVESVYNTESGLEGTRSDTSLEALGGDVKDGSSGSLGTSSSSGGDSNDGLELLVDGCALADGSVDKVVHVVVGVAREQVGGLGSVHGGTATDSEEVGNVVVASPVDGLDPGRLCGLDRDLVKDGVVVSLLLERGSDRLHDWELGDVGVGEDGNPGLGTLSRRETGKHVGDVHADLLGDTGTETEGRGCHLEYCQQSVQKTRLGVRLKASATTRTPSQCYRECGTHLESIVSVWVSWAWEVDRSGHSTLGSVSVASCARVGGGVRASTTAASSRGGSVHETHDGGTRGSGRHVDGEGEWESGVLQRWE